MKIIPTTIIGQNTNAPLKLMSILLISFLSVCCHKEKDNAPIDGVTGFSWKVYNVQETNDNFINPIPTDWILNLNPDKTFSVTLGSSVAGGIYSWNYTDPTTAVIKFSIKQWNSASQAPGIADKLKNIIQSADTCYSYRAPFFGQYPGPPASATMILKFHGNGGFFNVYR